MLPLRTSTKMVELSFKKLKTLEFHQGNQELREQILKRKNNEDVVSQHFMRNPGRQLLIGDKEMSSK